MNRGRLRIYLGYAPGAGTTCALLSEGHRRAEHGTDVVVAIAETHGRPHTEALLAGNGLNLNGGLWREATIAGTAQHRPQRQVRWKAGRACGSPHYWSR